MHTHLKLYNELCEKEQVDIGAATLYNEQALLLQQIENIYTDFDGQIEKMMEESLEICLKVQFIELYYFVLYQELLVLSNFEEPHKLLLKSMDTTTERMRKYEDEIRIFKHKFKEQLGDDALLDSNGKIIDTELLFKAIGT